MGKRRQGNYNPSKKTKNSIEALVENEGNEYTVSDPTRIMISMSNKLNEYYKEMLKKYLKGDFKEELMEELQEKYKGNIQKQLKAYQDNTDKKLEKTETTK
jgi:hypothetical protein